MQNKIDIPCLLCEKQVGSLNEEGILIAEGADGTTFFTSNGNYGSPFDPFNRSPYLKESIHIALCDTCLSTKSKEKKIVEATVKTSHTRKSHGRHYEMES